MAQIILFNKPFNVLCQFSDKDGRSTLADFIHSPELKDYYPAGRLDYDSEGLLLLTNDGKLQHRITDPSQKLTKTYWVQVEGEVSQNAINSLQKGVLLKDGVTLPAQVKRIDPPTVWPRTPPIRERKHIPTQWLEIIITEGRNRQVRRMTAAVDHPTLRLIRAAIGPWKIKNLSPGEFLLSEINLPKRNIKRPNKKYNAKRKI